MLKNDNVPTFPSIQVIIIETEREEDTNPTVVERVGMMIVNVNIVNLHS